MSADRLTLTEASWRYHVPVATLRYWLDKGELTRERDDRGNLALRPDEIEKKLADRDRDQRERASR